MGSCGKFGILIKRGAREVKFSIFVMIRCSLGGSPINVQKHLGRDYPRLRLRQARQG
jgi:hypothetical protein